MNKKGISPVIATVLLVSIVIVLALIIFLWATKFIQEAIEKQGKPADQACGEVDLSASVAAGQLYLTNNGNIPIFKIEKLEKTGGRVDKETVQVDLNIGQTKSDININPAADEIRIIPIILGETESGNQEYTCKDNPVIAE